MSLFNRPSLNWGQEMEEQPLLVPALAVAAAGSVLAVSVLIRLLSALLQLTPLRKTCQT